MSWCPQERFQHELATYGIIDATNGQYAGTNEDLLHQYCETENGIAVIGHDIIRAALTGHVRRVVIDGRRSCRGRRTQATPVHLVPPVRHSR